MSPADDQKVLYASARAKRNAQDVPEVSSLDREEMLEKTNQAIYKQNFELTVRNQTLSVLRSLYSITINSLKTSEVSQNIVNVITKELSFSAAMIVLLDKETASLKITAITKSDQVVEGLKVIAKPLEEIRISMEYPYNLIVNSIKEKERMITGNLLDIFTPELTQEKADEIEKLSKISTIIIYPLFIGDKTLGALCIGIAKKADDLSRAERETLEQLIDTVAISIERAQLYEDLQSANAQLQELDKLKDEFVSLASHELRTPMTAIKGSLSTILEGFTGDIPPKAREFLTAAYNENDRLLRLVNNLLNISRIEAGRFSFSMTNVDMDKLIKEVVGNLEEAATEKSIFLKYDKDGPVNNIRADEDKIKEVLINIIGNAIKFTHKGGITVRMKEYSGMVVTSITDTGSGIAPEDQDLLFKKFSQIRDNYAKPTGGTGLGLYICKQIIEGLKGKIWLESTVGVGSTFFFSLPIVQ
jgi:signal transduction histidine kinase